MSAWWRYGENCRNYALSSPCVITRLLLGDSEMLTMRKGESIVWTFTGPISGSSGSPSTVRATFEAHQVRLEALADGSASVYLTRHDHTAQTLSVTVSG